MTAPSAAAMDRAAAAFVAGQRAAEQMTPREQAEAAFTPADGRSIDEIEDSIRRRRGLALRQAS